jgi:hypothetical protein
LFFSQKKASHHADQTDQQGGGFTDEPRHGEIDDQEGNNRYGDPEEEFIHGQLSIDFVLIAAKKQPNANQQKANDFEGGFGSKPEEKFPEN